jgi:hypothetical protein
MKVLRLGKLKLVAEIFLESGPKHGHRPCHKFLGMRDDKKPTELLGNPQSLFPRIIGPSLPAIHVAHTRRSARPLRDHRTARKRRGRSIGRATRAWAARSPSGGLV